MLNILELAKKWMALNAAGHTPEEPGEVAEREAFTKRVGEIWLAYHDNAPWAQAKLDAGLRLSPEALQYMEREVEARRLADEALKKNLAIKDKDDVTAITVSRGEPAGDGRRDSQDSGSGVQETG